MFFGTFLQSVAIGVSVVLLCPATSCGESRVAFDEFVVHWQGDCQLRATKDDQGRMVIRCECRGDVRVSNTRFEAQAKRLAYDSAKQTLVLEGDVRLQAREVKGQPAVGQLLAERVTLKVTDNELLIESLGAKLNGTVRLRPIKN